MTTSVVSDSTRNKWAHEDDVGILRVPARSRAERAMGLTIPLVVLILLGLGLRLVGLTTQPLWWDEGYSVWFATHPLPQMLALTAADIHPPLYYALLRGWTLVLGSGPVPLRLFSVAAGTLAIPVIYVAGRRLFGSRVGLLAALLLAISPFHLYYSQEVRMYGLVALLSAGILAVAASIFARGTPGWRGLTLYVLLVLAALYSQYYAVFLPVGLTLYALWHWRRSPPALVRWLAAQLAVALLYLPWVMYASPRLIPYISQKVVADADRPLDLLPYVARHLAAFLAGHLEGPLSALWPLVLLLLLFWVLDFALQLRDRGSGPPAGQAGSWAMLAIVLGTGLLAGYAISRRYPFFPQRGERLLLLALPPFTLLNAAILADLWRRARLAAAAAIGLISLVAAASLLAFYTVPRYAGDDYRPLIARTVEQGRPEDTVFAVYPWQVGYWRSYGDPSGPQVVLSPSSTWDPEVAGALDRALRQGHVWFPAHLSLGAILETRIEDYLGRQARPFLNQWYGPGTRLSGWSAASSAEQQLTIAPVHFALPGGSDRQLSLTGLAGSRDPVPAANTMVPLTLTWQAARRPAELTASVRMVDVLGQIWAQHDYEPLGGSAPGPEGAGVWQGQDRIGLLVPAGTPPGAYRLEVVVQPKGGGPVLEALAADGKQLGRAAPLFDLTVAAAGRALGAERLPIAQGRPTLLGDGLRFLGFSAPDSAWVPGEARQVSLFWQANARPGSDYVAFLQLVGDSGKGPVAGWEAPPGAAYPTGEWAPGTLVRTQATLRLPAELPDGRYRLIAGLFRPGDGQRLQTLDGADHLSLGTVSVHGRPHVFTPLQPAAPANVQFGSSGNLIGYDLPAAGVAAGSDLPLRLYWRASGATPRPYTVFVHLVDANGALHGVGDGEPGGGHLATTGWLPGEYLVDSHTIPIDAGTPRGTYRLTVGMYDPATGERIALPDGSSQFTLPATVTVQ